MEITRDDIKRVEKILLRNGESFFDEKEERYAVIECLSTKDVNACPGSGKTTCLLAKLILLAEKMPFPDGSGICVLTHTNVAIDEIKRTIGTKANKLFNYPNHFGTFQSFVDKFFAIPYYRQVIGSPFGSIEDEVFNRVIANRCKGLPYGIQKYLEHKKNSIEYVQNLRFNSNRTTLSEHLNGESEFKNGGKVFDSLLKLKEKLFEDGYLCFDDAYSLAFEYLNKCPNLKKIISCRFRYIFIDEMQDSYQYQINLIKSIFDETVVIQQIGDPNQSIYGEGPSPGSETKQWVPSASALPISSSKRFNNSIAKILITVCIQDNSLLVGNNEIEEIAPHIITYTDKTIKNVIERFVELVHHYKIEDKEGGIYPIVAVGWVGDGKKDKITIQSYFKGYDKRFKKNAKPQYETLKSYLRQESTGTGKAYYDNIVQGMLRVLEFCGKKQNTTRGDRYFTKTSFIKYMKEKDGGQSIVFLFFENVSKWSKMIHFHENVFNQDVIIEIRLYIHNELSVIFDLTINSFANKFIDSDEESYFTADKIENMNYYPIRTDGLKHIKVKVANVHSVKGETHSATLYMETSFEGKTCSQYIIDQLTGIQFKPKPTGDVYKTQCLKMAYVGMSRPKYLLAFAAKEDRIIPRAEDLKKNGWEIVTA